MPDAPGWAQGAPRLAVEYADHGTNEDDLQTKIGELLAAGTELVWVVRLVGPRRVDVHRSGEAPRTVPGDAVLEAPGILSRPVPVDALFDHERAREVALSNLLAEHGYGSLDALHANARAEGEAAGRAYGLRRAVETVCIGLGIDLDEPRRAQISAADEVALDALLAHLATHRAWPG